MGTDQQLAHQRSRLTPLTPYTGFIPNETTMTSNPYVAHLIGKRGLTEWEIRQSASPAPKATYPRTIGGRTFETEADYQEALADFLNGM